MNYEIVLPILDDLEGYKDILYIEPSSCENQRDALETMALYFKREFGYDNLQYCKNEHTEDYFGILFCERAMDLVKDFDHYPNRVIGGACFRKMITGAYFLDWVWFHPFARNRKNLCEAWPKLRSKFGAFTLTKPLSAHMEKFLDKYGK